MGDRGSGIRGQKFKVNLRRGKYPVLERKKMVLGIVAPSTQEAGRWICEFEVHLVSKEKQQHCALDMTTVVLGFLQGKLFQTND